MRDFLRINKTNKKKSQRQLKISNKKKTRDKRNEKKKEKKTKEKQENEQNKQWREREREREKEEKRERNNGEKQKFNGITGDSLFDFLIFRRFSRGTTGASPPRSHPAPVTTAEQDKQKIRATTFHPLGKSFPNNRK